MKLLRACSTLLPFCLSFKCDGCLYNEFCMKWSAEREDLSLLPCITGTEKDAGPLLHLMDVAQGAGRHADDQHGEVALGLVPHPAGHVDGALVRFDLLAAEYHYSRPKITS
jgi:hypothetical protein